MSRAPCLVSKSMTQLCLKALLLLLALLAPACEGATYALIVAGSKSYENYRHQADAAHAYQAVLAMGVPRANIVTALYDDVVSDAENPYPGKLFNKPSGKAVGVNVHKDLAPDYSAEAVTKGAVLGALLCNSTAQPCLRGSGADDDIFVYWAGHGSDGTLLLPTGDPLYADELFSTLQQLAASTPRRFGRLLFYLEACDSGAMFSGHSAGGALAALGVTAFTAARPAENSYPAYCCDYFKPPSCTVFGQDVGSCLGDLWSVAVLEDMDGRAAGETIAEQFAVGKKAAAPAGGNPGNHAQQYGATALLADTLASFFNGSAAPSSSASSFFSSPSSSSSINSSAPARFSAAGARNATAASAPGTGGGADALLHMLRWRLARDERAGLAASALAAAAARVSQEEARRARVEREYDAVAAALFGAGSSARSVLAARLQQQQQQQQQQQRRRQPAPALAEGTAAIYECRRAADRARATPHDAFSVQFVGVTAAACEGAAGAARGESAAVAERVAEAVRRAQVQQP